ncbi:MAG TPA: hypothetical protein VK809_02770, partial [Bacteroidia bacterium]|nr:hypothetical protein [Bacteroidia bacterium]
MRKIPWFLIITLICLPAIFNYGQKKILPAKIPITQLKPVNFSELAKYELANPLVKKIGFINPANNPNLNTNHVIDTGYSAKFNILPELPGERPIRKIAIQSPPPMTSFNGIMDDGIHTPDVNGAAGNTYLMETTNTSFSIYTKSGTLVSSVTPDDFFSAEEGNSGDPRIAYDFANNRYIILDYGADMVMGHGVYIGISQTDDPRGNWWRYFFPTTGNDYPLLGYNTNWLVITIASAPQTIYVFNRTSLYSGTLGSVNIFTDPTEMGYWGPALTYDNTQTKEYLVQEWNSNSGGYGYVKVANISGTADAPVFDAGSTIGINNPWNDNNLILASQNGGMEKLEGGDSRINNAIYINNSLWFCHSVNLPLYNPTHSGVDWWQIDPVTPSIIQYQRIEDLTAANFYFYPNISVNPNNDVLMGYCQSSATMYASAAYSMHTYLDPTNVMETPNIYKSGLGYYNIVTSTNPRNRWGDFTGTAVDPVDGSFWSFGLFANTGNHWGTVIANIKIPQIPDLYIQDVPADNGTEPDPSTLPMYQSQDIWLRQMPDPDYTYAHMTQDASYPNLNTIYVEVHNRGRAA